MTMKIKLRGVFKSIDKHGRGHLIFLSEYHYRHELPKDFTREQLKSYDEKFQALVQEKKYDDIDEVRIISPLKYQDWVINFSKNVKYLNDQSELIVSDELLSKEVLIDAIIRQYEFNDRLNKDKKIKIIGWKIVARTIKESKVRLSS